MLVHEFCKLLGKHGGIHGAPEYAHRSVAFPDFLYLVHVTQVKPCIMSNAQ